MVKFLKLRLEIDREITVCIDQRARTNDPEEYQTYSRVLESLVEASNRCTIPEPFDPKGPIRIMDPAGGN